MMLIYIDFSVIIYCSSGSVGTIAYRNNIVPFVEGVIAHYDQ